MNRWTEMIKFFTLNEFSACVTSPRHLREFMKAVSNISELSRAEPPDLLLCSPYCSIHHGCRVWFIAVGNNEDMTLHSYSVIQSMSLCSLVCISVYRKSFWTRVGRHEGTRNGSVRGLQATRTRHISSGSLRMEQQLVPFAHFLCKCSFSFHIIVIKANFMVWIMWPGLYGHPAANSHRFLLDLQHFWLQLPAWALGVITVSGVICQVRHLTSRSRNLHSGVPQTFILKGNVSLSYQKKMRDKLTVIFSKEILKKSVLHEHLSYSWHVLIRAPFRCVTEAFLRLKDSIVCVVRTG